MPMAGKLLGLKVAILITNGFEQAEMVEPKKALEKAGASVQIVSPEPYYVKGWNNKNWGEAFPVDVTLSKATGEDYDALVLPGGVINPDTLRINKHAITFIHEFVQANKPIAAICHGPWTLINAGGVEGRLMTSWPSLRADLKNAGALWVNKKVVRDQHFPLVTSRRPEDLPAFNKEMITLFSEIPVASRVNRLKQNMLIP